MKLLAAVYNWLFAVPDTVLRGTERQALGVLVSRYPREYIDISLEELSTIPKGGSIFPWRYRRQVAEALDRAEMELIANHSTEWWEIRSMCITKDEIEKAEPRDFLG